MTTLLFYFSNHATTSTYDDVGSTFLGGPPTLEKEEKLPVSGTGIIMSKSWLNEEINQILRNQQSFWAVILYHE